MDAIYRTRLAGSKEISLTAKRINVDELAARRGEEDTEIEFVLIIGFVDETTDNPVVSGRMNSNKGNWILIQTDIENNHVRFDVYR